MRAQAKPAPRAGVVHTCECAAREKLGLVVWCCLKCDGKGHLDHHTVERKYVLSSLDFENQDAAKQAFSRTTLGQIPAETQRQIDLLASTNPRERLQACIWLDKNYVRKGQHFQELLPMLRKARWQESSDKKRLML